MLILAGLLGMLALGSVMLIEPSTKAEHDSEDEPLEDLDEAAQSNDGELGNTSLDLLSFIDEDGVTQTLENEATDAGERLIGTNEADEISAQGGDDNVMAGGGNDTVHGNAGADVLHGNGGEDVLSGDEGDDALFGDQGADALFGNDGNDSLFGNEGDDYLSGGAGSDSLFGGMGYDTLWGDAGNDTLTGNEGDDLLDGGEGQDLLNGGNGSDILNGVETDEDSADFLNGGDGDDTIYAGAGDQVSGGEGADTTVLSADLAEHANIWDFESGQDTLVVLYDPSADAPEINISQDPDTIGQWLVQADGETVAHITGDAPTLSDISLIESA